MKVLIVSTSERVGGAAIAASRLAQALQRNGVEVRMLVRDKQTALPYVVQLPSSWLHKLRFLWERLCIFLANGFRRDVLFRASLANTGVDITCHPLFRWADVVHLHWVNHGMLSLADIQKMAKQGKPLVWTMHDVWTASGISHHEYYATKSNIDKAANGMPLLLSMLDNLVLNRKRKLYDTSNIVFVACSSWLKNVSKSRVLLAHQQVVNIPNPIDTQLFSPKDKVGLRAKYNLPQDKKLLLFGAMKLSDKRKGIDYLIDACNTFKQCYPQESANVELLIMGGKASDVEQKLPFVVHSLGFVSDEHVISEVYALADAFITPSLEENLPNTIMEALACGTPCVGFAVGGIPEMIEHQRNGYVATYKNVADLAVGIHQTLFGENSQEWSRNARQKVLAEYSETVVAEQYKQIYQNVVANHKTISR